MGGDLPGQGRGVAPWSRSCSAQPGRSPCPRPMQAGLLVVLPGGAFQAQNSGDGWPVRPCARQACDMLVCTGVQPRKTKTVRKESGIDGGSHPGGVRRRPHAFKNGSRKRAQARTRRLVGRCREFSGHTPRPGVRGGRMDRGSVEREAGKGSRLPSQAGQAALARAGACWGAGGRWPGQHGHSKRVRGGGIRHVPTARGNGQFGSGRRTTERSAKDVSATENPARVIAGGWGGRKGMRGELETCGDA